ncbi:hypothetical protein DFH05DRAFT_712574 [Lentinula detonsa]|uniref:Secreted protein n=1 Tax=Lentinula detonsa TaxID=2804962 RepID=A0A9W8NQU7_9AGAR|nr:hypothetical protein DFH05DRAFT_712574 [Lentinula detonsa]
MKNRGTSLAASSALATCSQLVSALCIRFKLVEKDDDLALNWHPTGGRSNEYNHLILKIQDSRIIHMQYDNDIKALFHCT